MEGKTQEAAAAAAGMSVRSARKWERGPGPAHFARARHWRTRRDPFAEVFTNEVIPLLEADREGVLEAKTILTELERRHPGQFGAGQLRTLQRRLREWRAVEGPDKEVYFPQHHPPGREAAYDFTDLSGLGVSIAGEPFAHLLFELVLSFSGWRWPLVVFSENFETLSTAVQGALWELGGAVEVLRSDNLSAATHQLYRARGRALTKRYRELLDHYGLRASPINPGHAHENGVVEQAHRRSKSLLAQALLLRRSRDFISVEDYQSWVRATIERDHNHLRAAKLAEEKLYLRPLPEAALPCHTVMLARVRRWSTIRVHGRTYSVPARLIGEQVRILVHADRLDVYYRERAVASLPRLRGRGDARIDYHHVIFSLVRKPGAFTRYRWREELFPSVTFRRAYDALLSRWRERADREYVRVLHLAALNGENAVEEALTTLLERDEGFDAERVRQMVQPPRPPFPQLVLEQPDPSRYDALLGRVTS